MPVASNAHHVHVPNVLWSLCCWYRPFCFGGSLTGILDVHRCYIWGDVSGGREDDPRPDPSGAHHQDLQGRGMPTVQRLPA